MTTTRIPSWKSNNPFLNGAYAPVFDECDAVDLPIQGEIPRSLDGVFMRNGPNPQFEPSSYLYPFDGTGMIHGVYLSNGSARYRNRWVLTRELLEERAAGQRLYGSTFGPPPNANLANTSIIHHAGRYLALYEAGTPYELDHDLNTIGPFDYAGLLPRNMSAHPKLDPVTGELIAVAYDADSPHLHYLEIDHTGVLKKIITFESPWRAMIHDIALTTNYVVVFVCPFLLATPEPYWKPSLGTAVAVIPRHGTEREITWLECAPFFHFHVMNAFESDEYIEVQLPWMSSYGGEAAKRRLELHMLKINLETRTVIDEPVDDCACEFPRINERFTGTRNRFGYVAFRNRRAGEVQSPGVFEALARYDFATGARTVRTLPSGQFVGEPVFAPDPSGKGEDSGFIMTYVYDARLDSSSLEIYDAQNLMMSPLARIKMPRRIPAGLHGSWIPNRIAGI